MAGASSQFSVQQPRSSAADLDAQIKTLGIKLEAAGTLIQQSAEQIAALNQKIDVLAISTAGRLEQLATSATALRDSIAAAAAQATEDRRAAREETRESQDAIHDPLDPLTRVGG